MKIPPLHKNKINSELALKNPPKNVFFFLVLLGFLNFGLVCAEKALKSLLKANKRKKKLLERLKSQK